jgi:asparagine synthase (glutamine-hydrolysing)
MSGIFGIVHLDGSPVLESELSAMRSAMQEWGPDAGAIWNDGPAGLGSLISFDTPEAVHESSPLRSEQGFVLTAEARLDNRDELCTDLAIPASERGSLADGHLVLHAYEKWGAATPSHLLGDWSFAAWHPAGRRLFLARDHFGATGLFYFQDSRRFAFSSSRNALFALGAPRRLNEFFLACILVSWTAQHGSATIDLDVHRLPPAHTLTLLDRRPRVDQYWRLEDTPTLRLRSSSDYVEGMLAVYDRAVRDRLRAAGPVAVSLSGGLDSGSTAVLAARTLQERGGRLRAYTSVPAHGISHADTQSTFGDEYPLARATAGAAGNIDLVPVAAESVTPIQAIRDSLAVHGEPAHAAANMYWIGQLLRTAAGDGVRALLSAQGGNATVSWSGVDQAGLFRTVLKRRHWKLAAEIMIYPHLPLEAIRLFRAVRHRRGLDWTRTSINTDFARRIDLSRLYIAHSGDATKSEEWYPARRRRFAIIRPGASYFGSVWSENSAAYGVDIRDATYDRRVMEFTLSIPEREFRDSSGMDRRMLRLAMQGLLPDEVRLNRRRGMQAADLGYRLLASAAEVESTFAELDRSELAHRYLDLQRMRGVWQLLQRGVDYISTHDAVTILTRGLMAGLHLAAREDSV